MKVGGDNKQARMQTFKARLLDATEKFKSGDFSTLDMYAECLYEYEVVSKILRDRGYPRISEDCTESGLIAMVNASLSNA